MTELLSALESAETGSRELSGALRDPDPVYEDLQPAIEAEREVEFWGVTYAIKPTLVRRVFGDGQKLLGISVMDTRPNYYVVRVGANWSISNWEMADVPYPPEYLPHVFEAIEEQFGLAWQDAEGEYIDEPNPWPALGDEDCCSWFEHEWPEGIALIRAES